MTYMIVADIENEAGKWVKTYREHGVHCFTGSYVRWSNMMSRCNANGAYQRRQKTYQGCHASDMFRDFQTFTDWYVKQAGYGLPRYQLDKDLLINGNKLYSEDTCVLIPHQLNTFISNKQGDCGEWPCGVYFHKKSGKYMARVSLDGGSKYLGLFVTPEEAHTAYVVAKEEQSQQWAVRLRNKEFIVDDRVIVAMENWRVNG